MKWFNLEVINEPKLNLRMEAYDAVEVKATFEECLQRVVRNVVEVPSVEIYHWRAWNAGRERICDCGVAIAASIVDALGVAIMCLGGPFKHEVLSFQIENAVRPEVAYFNRRGERIS